MPLVAASLLLGILAVGCNGYGNELRVDEEALAELRAERGGPVYWPDGSSRASR